MIQLKSTAKGVEGYHNVYENEEEFTKSGLPWVDNFNDLEVGMYMKCPNGYYIPLLKIISYKDDTMRRYQFPRAQYTSTRAAKTGRWYTPKILYHPQHRVRTKIKDGDAALFVQLVFAGMSPTKAWTRIGIARGKQTQQNLNNYFDLLTSDNLHKAIKDIMKQDMKEGFKDNGMDSTWYANVLKGIAEDPKANKDVKLQAMAEIKMILDHKADPEVKDAKIKMDDLRKSVLKKYEDIPRDGTNN